jgi:hypothetical protein
MRINGLLDLFYARTRARPIHELVRDVLSQFSPFRKWSIPS